MLPSETGSDLGVSRLLLLPSLSPLLSFETSSHQEFSISPPITTGLAFPTFSLATQEDHLVYN